MKRTPTKSHQFRFFISHFEIEKDLAQFVASKLRQAVIWKRAPHIFLAPYNMRPAKDWRNQIKKNLQAADALVTILTRQSLTRPWVIGECFYAWAINKPNLVLFSPDLSKKELPSFVDDLQYLDTAAPDFGEQFVKAICDISGCHRNIQREHATEINRECDRRLQNVAGPGLAVRLWNESLKTGDIQKASQLTSKTSESYVKRAWGSIDELSKKYQRGRKFQTVVERSVIEGNVARVDYTTLYDDEYFSVRKWTDFVILEDDQWKIAPQYVVYEEATPATRIKLLSRRAKKSS